MDAMNLGESSRPPSPPLPEPKLTIERREIIDQVQRELAQGKGGINLVVIGHVDAGKSTLMGRMLYELGVMSEKEKTSNERGSAKMGKSSFQYAWALDGTVEERERYALLPASSALLETHRLTISFRRGVTMDIAQDHFVTPHRHFTLLDAPGHRDFIPNMISGAAQADAALLVVDAGMGEFESGFGHGGQTREHALLVRSLGVQQIVVVVNKLDTVDWSQGRFDDIQDEMRPFLLQSGFLPAKTLFVPVGAMQGVNLVDRAPGQEVIPWYSDGTLVELLGALSPPSPAPHPSLALRPCLIEH